MAKFKDLHLLVQEEQRILFGDDSLGTYGPAEYPATNLGSEKPFIAYTTISGYNDELPGGGIINIVATEQLVVSVPLAGERGTQPYHMVRFDQLQDAIFDEVSSDWQDSVLTFSGTPPGAPSDNDRYIVEATATGDWTGLEDYIVEWSTASGTWETYPPNEGFTTFVEDEDKYYLYYNGSWAPMGEGIDHGDLKGLGDDDHVMYVPTDGSRGFTNTVSGIDPTQDYHLSTKSYVDTEITTVTNLIPTDHDELNGLGDDDHVQYILVDGSRGFTNTVSGVDPTLDYHLATKWYVDDALTSASGGDNTFLGLNDTYIAGDVYTADNMLYTSSSGVHDTANMTYDSATGDINLGVAGEPRLVIDADSDAKLHGDDDTYITVSGTGAAFVEGGSLELSVDSDGVALATGARVDDIQDSLTGTIDSSSTDTQIATAKLIYDAITTATGSLTSDHGDLTGLGDDDHTHYTLADGTRAFTGTVSGIDPTVDAHLTTKQYVDDAITTATGSLTSDHGDLTGLADDDHPQYTLVDGSRGFTNTISGVYPVVDSDLTTKKYVDDQFTTLSGTQKWGRISCIDTARNQAVTFSGSFPGDDYTLVATLTNEVDSPPSIYSTIQGIKTAAGFTTHFSGKIDSDNFILEWIAFYGQQH